jgi:hypothetical protein
MSSTRLTVLNLVNSRIPAALGICLPSDRTRFLQWLNEAEDRLLAYGRWYGSIQEVQFCVSGCVLTWPREVATIEALSLPCRGGPVDIRNDWYNYTQAVATLNQCHDWGSGSCGNAGMTIASRMACSFETTQERGSTIRFYPASSSDIGKTILVQGRDTNNIWVRTNPTGTQVLDGELVTLAMPFADTVTTWMTGNPLGLQKQATNYRVLMYEHSLSTLQDRPLGTYQASETNPSYRTSIIPSLDQACGGASSCCGLTTIKALVKLAHVELSSDDDWLLFQNIAAYKEAMLAIRDWENGDIASGNIHFYGMAAPKQARASNQATLRQGGAIPMLRAELRGMTSDRTEVEMHFEAGDGLQYQLAGYR